MTRRGLAVCICAFSLLLAAVAARSSTLALVALPFIAYLCVALVEAPWRALDLKAERSVEVERAGGAAEVRVRVTVRNEGSAVPVLRLWEEPPQGVSVSHGDARRAERMQRGGHPRRAEPMQRGGGLCRGELVQCGGSLRRGERMQLEYSFTAAKGAFSWTSVHAVASDPFRLFDRVLHLPASGEAVVRPQVRRLRPFTLSPDRTLQTPGSILGGRAGSGTDFWGVREYYPGDEMRRLDWRRAARHPGQLFTREHEQEEIADIGLIVDAREEVDLHCGNQSLADVCVDAAASLSEMFLRGGNRVGLVLLATVMKVVHPGYGKVQLQRLLRALAGANPGASPSRVSLDNAPMRMFSTRAMVVVLSPLTAGDWELFPRLRARGNEVLVISPDPVRLGHDGSLDRAERLARRVARVERRLDLRRLTQLGIRVLDWHVGEPLGPLVRRATRPIRGRTG